MQTIIQNYVQKMYHISEFDENDKHVGYVNLIIYKRPNEEYVGLIEDLFIEEQYRHNGLGTKLMEEAIKLAKQEKCYKITLTCADHNIEFYQKLGFRLYQNAMRLNLN